ncbi:MAG TPA: SDR family oxidoreductase, partial [Gemmataceae bacterium]|nr:SDR family oxidoreductase [Gemmataceae bacterium]
MDLGLSDDVAVIVGGAKGIGRAIAAAFAEEGAHLALVDRDPSVGATAGELSARHRVQALPLVGDVTDAAAMRSAAARVKDELGRVDHVVHAAAIGSGKFGFPFWNLEPSDWPRVLEVNVVGNANVAHAFAPPLIEARRGTMLFVASIAGQIGSQTDPPYSASKAAVINFMQCCAKDLAPFGVRVNALCPGMVKTELNRAVWAAWAARQKPEERQSYEEWAGDKIRRMVPLGRWQEQDDVAAMVV